MTKQEAIEKAAEAVREYGFSGWTTDPQPVSDAVRAALDAGATLDDIADHNRAHH